ncbi:hypothetical protein SFRURICE_019478, partial [Spodoptera frugiperda]
MYSNMCVKIALCLALIVSIDGYVLKHRSVPLSPEGLILEVAVRDKNDPRHPISAMKIDINEKDKKVDMSSVELSTEGTNSGNVPRNVPTLEDRVSIIGGGCPQDTTSTKSHCNSLLSWQRYLATLKNTTMYSNMCVKIALCLALIVSIDGYVLKHRSVPLSPEGLILEIAVRDKNDPRHPISTMKIDINEKDHKVEISMAEVPQKVAQDSNDVVPVIEDRSGVNVGTCPAGFTRTARWSSGCKCYCRTRGLGFDSRFLTKLASYVVTISRRRVVGAFTNKHISSHTHDTQIRNNNLWITPKVYPYGNQRRYTLHGSQLRSHRAKRAGRAVLIAVCLALVACATSHVLKHQELPLSSDGMILEITVKNKGDDHPLSSMVVDINEKDRKVSITVQEPAETVPKGTVTVSPDGVPTIGNRHGIIV